MRASAGAGVECGLFADSRGCTADLDGAGPTERRLSSDEFVDLAGSRRVALDRSGCGGSGRVSRPINKEQRRTPARLGLREN